MARKPQRRRRQRIKPQRRRRQRIKQDFSAKFVCALCVALPRGEARIFEGEVKGRAAFPPRGLRGFGYDPIFIADGMTETFGEIDPAVKHAMSHRARAFRKAAAWRLFPETM